MSKIAVIDWKKLALAVFRNGHWKTYSGYAVWCDRCQIRGRQNQEVQHKPDCPFGKIQKYLKDQKIRRMSEKLHIG